MLQNVGSNRARHAAHVVKGEIVSDDASPTVGAEFDRSHWSLVDCRWSLVDLSLVVGMPRLGLANDRRRTTNGSLLDQPMEFFLIQMFHNFAHILRLPARRDQQRIVRLYHD